MSWIWYPPGCDKAGRFSNATKLKSQAMSHLEKIVVVIPAYNEAKAVGQVLSAIPQEIDGMDVTALVVDDGSKDGTADVARRHGAHVVRHVINLGVGAGTRTGLMAAKALDANIIVTIDADGQHDPGEIRNLVRCLIDNGFDVVIGSRLLQPVGMPLSRLAANLLLNALTFVAYGKVVSDSQSGFKAFSRTALDKMELKSAGYEICSEIIGEIVRNDLSYKSLPIKAVYTNYSKAKGQHFLNGVNLILQLFERMMRRV
jgi:glycosyltransferase involved in cell wall biosynthesis